MFAPSRDTFTEINAWQLIEGRPIRWITVMKNYEDFKLSIPLASTIKVTEILFIILSISSYTNCTPQASSYLPWILLEQVK